MKHHFLKSCPYSSRISSIPASLKRCHASAWLLEVTGFPITLSAFSIMFSALKLVQDIKTPSQLSFKPKLMTDCNIDSSYQ